LNIEIKEPGSLRGIAVNINGCFVPGRETLVADRGNPLADLGNRLDDSGSTIPSRLTGTYVIENPSRSSDSNDRSPA
jgi:hypothetical protein